MSLIPCKDPCIYQEDGRCRLSRAVSAGYPTDLRPCVHYLPKDKFQLQENRQSFPNIPYLD